MFDSPPDEKPEPRMTLSFCEALMFSGLDRGDLYDLLVANRLPVTGGIPADRLARILDRSTSAPA